MEEKSREKSDMLDEKSLCIGVDGCKGGWIVAVIDKGKLRIERFARIDDIVSKYPVFDEFLIDMVIGFQSDKSHIRPDSAARKIIPGRASTIFDVPSRQAVYAESKQEQIQKNKEALGKSLGAQTSAIIPKMRELDMFLNHTVKYKNVIKESHPEVCFARLNGAVVMSRKKDKDGMWDRIQILNAFLPHITADYVLEMAKKYKCMADDIVDAICLAVTANLNIQGKGEEIPSKPMVDACGLLMRMVIPKKDWAKGMIKFVTDAVEKEQIAAQILYNLPDWFGLPESTREYISESKNLPFWAYLEGDAPRGFIVLKETAPRTAEIYVMGVLQESHRKGIGTALWESFLQYARNQGYEYVQVKTVQSGKYKEYDITNAFYKSLGFRELEVFPTLWGEENPCQIYVRYIGHSQYLYHGSKASDIKVLDAKSKLHNTDKQVVYLTGSVPYALVYIWDAEHIGYDRKHVTCAIKGGKVIYEEQFPGQLETFYKGVSGYLYCVDNTDAFRSVEERESMFYSLVDAPVSKVVYIEDVYEELMKYEREGKFQVWRFHEASKEKQEELVQRVAHYIENGNFLNADSPKARFYEKYFKAAWELAGRSGMKKLMLLLVFAVLLMSGCSFSSNDDLSNYTTLKADEILTMEDNDMYDALITRFMDTDPNTLNQKQLTVAALITFDAEMMNGGLCQFFVNDYNGYAQYINDALGEVGAIEMQEHYSSFVSQNEIDVTQMDSFRIVSIQDYMKQFERFPYEAFDNTFSEIYQKENLGNLLLSYVRLHGDEILD